ncbi:hypothetical protein [Paraburkholderia sp. SARCC-3016]|uniref:hypothetical protein n=1 Tax=Paraburkholderia sp. SARCC-3016 TaxID=3058611 RepID=UPI00280B2FCD|nr:hypothetical protein [Paraburkholderia sp. SARCC-3016]
MLDEAGMHMLATSVGKPSGDATVPEKRINGVAVGEWAAELKRAEESVSFQTKHVAQIRRVLGVAPVDTVETLQEEIERLTAILSARATASDARPAIDSHDLSTSEGGRGYIAEFFSKRLRRHDFARYIAEKLAADFACALADYLSEDDAARAEMIAERDAAVMSAHRQALCIQQCAAHIGPDTSATIDGLPLAVKRVMRERDEANAVMTDAHAAIHSVLIAGGDCGDELADAGLRDRMYASRSAIRCLLAGQSQSASEPAEARETDYAALEREHMGDPDKRTGIYGPRGSAPERKAPLTEAAMREGWHQTFSTNNTFCPCDFRTFTKVVRWAERALAASTTGAQA